MLKRILFFYIDGFKNLSDLGQKLWVIIIIKLVVIFVVIRAFLMPTLDSKMNKKAQEKLYINALTKMTTTTKKEE